MLKRNLPREYFVSREVFDRETELVFARNWICVEHLSEFPAAPSFKAFELGSHSVVVSRPSANEVHAFHNVCRHRGARLCSESEGPVKNGAIACPYHAWTYNVRGELIGAPDMSDQPDFDRSDFPLLPISGAIWNGFVMLHLGGGNANFADDYRPVIERLANWFDNDLAVGETIRYEVPANWKLLFQNYNECYHCPTVHPALNRLTPYKTATNDLTSGPFLGGPMELEAGFETVSRDGRLVAERLPSLTAEQRSRVYFYTLFPTMFVSPHPDYVMVHVLSRRDESRTDVACYFLVPKSGMAARNGQLKRATELWDEVNRQDWEMCGLTQLGAASPAFRPGPYSRLESMVLAFDEHYRSVMEELGESGRAIAPA